MHCGNDHREEDLLVSTPISKRLARSIIKASCSLTTESIIPALIITQKFI